MPDERPVLEVRDLNCWHGAHKVLRDIHINVRKGNICGLLGPNGSGKTTLFRCILNFHKAYAGAVHICGHSTRKLPPARMARLVSYVPQEHHAAFPFSVRDIVRMGRNPFLAAAFHFGKEHELAVDQALEFLNMREMATKTYTSLSGGQRQLTLIARAVAQQAPLMLLDEPTSALDFHNQIELWKALRSLAAKGFAVVVCCHDPNHILWFCDQAVLIKNGEILDSGHPGTVLENDALNNLYGESCIKDELSGGIQVIRPPAEVLSWKYPGPYFGNNA